MANPIETLTKVVGFGIQQGTKILGGAISAVTGRGGDDAAQEQEAPVKRAARQRRASQQPKPLDDVTITRKVETEIFRGSKARKGKISVNTADGVVWLRGEAKNPEQVKELEAKAKAIPEVKRVENLLHLPKTPAPTRTDTPPRQRKTRATKSTQSQRKVTAGRTTSEKQTATAAKEAAPAEQPSTAPTEPAPAEETSTAPTEPAPAEQASTASNEPAPAEQASTAPKEPAPAEQASTAPKEPAPADLAAAREGRPPSPLGTDEGTDNGGTTSSS